MSWSKHKSVDSNIHVMNKNERKALRQLKAKLKQSELDIRKSKKNRKTLSDAQKRHGDKSPHERMLLRIQKQVTKKMKLPREHPLVKEALIEAFNERRKNVWGWFRGEYMSYSNEELLHQLNYLNTHK